jgi:hypothetical protein
MKLVAILSLLFFNSVLAQNELTAAEATQHLLNFLARMVTSMNFLDIPSESTNIPSPKMMSCISSEQRALIDICSNEVIKRWQDMNQPKSGQMRNASSNGGGRAGGRRHKRADPQPVHITGCLNVRTALVDKETGEINVENLRKFVIDKSTISAAQKTAAAASLDTCLASDFTIPRWIPTVRQNGAENEISAADRSAILKAFVCAVKALVMNGCPTASSARMALMSELHDTFEFLAI